MKQPEARNSLFSVVIPIYNEEGNIAALDRELRTAMSILGGSYEVIYVNDGSTDSSLDILKKLGQAKIIDLNRNYGQAIALDAGFKAASGEIIISLDGDGQNDPADISMLVKKLRDENLDVVAGWRKNRKDPGRFLVLTRVGRMLRSFLVADTIHDSGCTLRVYRREVIKSLDLGGEMHRYIMSIIKWKGFRIGEMEVNHRPRRYGKSNYKSDKALRGFFDLVYVWFMHKYSERPLHLFGYMSFATFIVSIVSFTLSIYQKFGEGLSLNRNAWFFIALFFFLGSVIFFTIGIVLDFIIRLHLNNSPYEKRYYIRNVIER